MACPSYAPHNLNVHGKQDVESAEVITSSRLMVYAMMQALESAETKKSKIQAAERDLQLQRVQGGVQGRPSMLRRFVKSVTARQGSSLESTIKSLIGEVSMQRPLPPLPPLPPPPLPFQPWQIPHGQKVPSKCACPLESSRHLVQGF